MKLLHMICVVAVACAAATTDVHALDAGPASGGGLSANPNNRSPRTESTTADGGPMSGTSSSTNPNTSRPAASADAGPATSAGDAGPPISGGDMSTNPNLRTPAPSPTATTAVPVVTTKKPAATTETPPASITSKPPATITEKPPASITEKPTATPTPTITGDSSDVDDEVPSAPTPQETDVLDFSVINGDKSGARDVVGEVTPDKREDSIEVVADEVAGEADIGEVANEADEPTQSETTQSAATPSPTSKKNASNTKSTSSAVRSALPSNAALFVATIAVVMASVAL